MTAYDYSFHSSKLEVIGDLSSLLTFEYIVKTKKRSPLYGYRRASSPINAGRQAQSADASSAVPLMTYQTDLVVI